MQHIRESLPELRERLQKRLHEAEAELAGYGDPLLEAKGNAGALLLHFFSKFARNFQVRLRLEHGLFKLIIGIRMVEISAELLIDQASLVVAPCAAVIRAGFLWSFALP